MNLTLIVLPEAEEDVREVAAWYEAQRPGLGLEFIGTLEVALAGIRENPRCGSIWPDEERYRRFSLHRFPYLVFYELRPDSIEIIAVAHFAREPGFWARRSR